MNIMELDGFAVSDKPMPSARRTRRMEATRLIFDAALDLEDGSMFTKVFDSEKEAMSSYKYYYIALRRWKRIVPEYSVIKISKRGTTVYIGKL